MPMYQFEAMDRTGQEIKDVIEAPSEEEAQTTIRQMGYFVTKISLKKSAVTKKKGVGRKRSFTVGGAKSSHIATFTRQLSILQDAGLPILRSLKILENNAKPGKLKNSLMDVCDEIETGATLSEGLAKCPRNERAVEWHGLVRRPRKLCAHPLGQQSGVHAQHLRRFQRRAAQLRQRIK